MDIKRLTLVIILMLSIGCEPSRTLIGIEYVFENEAQLLEVQKTFNEKFLVEKNISFTVRLIPTCKIVRFHGSESNFVGTCSKGKILYLLAYYNHLSDKEITTSNYNSERNQTLQKGQADLSSKLEDMLHAKHIQFTNNGKKQFMTRDFFEESQ